MRESLGVALHNDVIATALVDADTPLLGAIDEFRHPWGTDGPVPPAQSSARALRSAVDVATDRAARSHLRPTSVGVMCARADVRDLLSDSLSTGEFENVELVSSLEARLAYLRTVDALAGLSSILMFWPEDGEMVIAAIDLRTGTLDSAHRYDSSELLASSSVFCATLDSIVAEHEQVPKMLVAMGISDGSREMSAQAAELAGLGFMFLGDRAQLAIGAALVAAARSDSTRALGGVVVSSITRSRKWRPFALFATLLGLGGMLIALLFTLAPDNTRKATDPPNSDEVPAHAPSGTADQYPASIPDAGTDANGGGQRASPPSLFDALPPCDPVAPAAPAGFRRSDPDLPVTIPPLVLPTAKESGEACAPAHQG